MGARFRTPKIQGFSAATCQVWPHEHATPAMAPHLPPLNQPFGMLKCCALPKSYCLLPIVSDSPLNPNLCTNPRIRSLDVLTVHYSPGALLLSEAAAGDGRSAKLLLAARNLALPAAASVNTGLTSGVPGLRELVTELEQHIPGESGVVQ